ncbi:TetR/AcrR family transcriptional regulator [Brevibacterium salitolerans]|uniref:TetR/AcrR family transcriptional regulator n=1 Tax=Brevibacterium salitolerans TaxID=1403566 RepID=A0ABP5I2R8_9MICO
MSGTGTKRETYHHGALRSALLDAASAMLEAGEAFSLRAVARRAGVSQTAPYRHFADREALEAALAVRGFHELRRCLSPDGAAADSTEELIGFAVAYVRFALDRPALFTLMFGQECDDQDDERVRAAGELRGLLTDSVRGAFPAADAEALATTLWALTHGLAFLHLDGKLPAGTAEQVEARVRGSFATLRALAE